MLYTRNQYSKSNIFQLIFLMFQFKKPKHPSKFIFPFVNQEVLFSLSQSCHSSLFKFFFQRTLICLFIWLCWSLAAGTWELRCIMRALWRCTDSLLVTRRLQSRRAHTCGVPAWLLRSIWHLSSLTRDQTHVPCIARQIL